jgi:hypothetical protein
VQWRLKVESLLNFLMNLHVAKNILFMWLNTIYELRPKKITFNVGKISWNW